MGVRKLIFLEDETEGALKAIADAKHGGNASATLAAALDSYIEQQALIAALVPQLIVVLWHATEPSGEFAPSDDDRAAAPTAALAGLIGEAEAQAVVRGLRLAWAEMEAQ